MRESYDCYLYAMLSIFLSFDVRYRKCILQYDDLSHQTCQLRSVTKDV